MKEYKDIKDDQIRIIGEDDRKKSPFRHPRMIILAICVLLLIGGGILFVIMNREKASETGTRTVLFRTGGDTRTDRKRMARFPGGFPRKGIHRNQGHAHQ